MAENESTQNPAPSPAPATEAAQPSPAERRAAIEKSKAYSDATDPGHAEAVQAAYRLRQEEETGTRRKTAEEDVDADGEPILHDFTGDELAALPHVDDARRHAGYTEPVMPASLKETWDETAEADVVENFFIPEGIPGTTVQRIMDRYVEMMTIGGRSETGIREGDEQDWMAFLTDECRLTKAQATRLVRWHQQNSEHAAAAAAEAVEDLLHQRRAQS